MIQKVFTVAKYSTFESKNHAANHQNNNFCSKQIIQNAAEICVFSPKNGYNVGYM